jgi:hypothetical protein
MTPLAYSQSPLLLPVALQLLYEAAHHVLARASCILAQALALRCCLLAPQPLSEPLRPLAPALTQAALPLTLKPSCGAKLLDAVLEALPEHQLSWFPLARHVIDTQIASLLLCIAQTAASSTSTAGAASSSALPGLRPIPHGRQYIQVLAKHPGLPLLLARKVARAVEDPRDSVWAQAVTCIQSANLVLAACGLPVLPQLAAALCAGNLPQQLLQMLQMMADKVGPVCLCKKLCELCELCEL